MICVTRDHFVQIRLYIYLLFTIANNYYIKIPTGAEFLKAAVQVPTNIKIINTNALLFQSNGISTLPILDSGTI